MWHFGLAVMPEDRNGAKRHVGRTELMQSDVRSMLDCCNVVIRSSVSHETRWCSNDLFTPDVGIDKANCGNAACCKDGSRGNATEREATGWLDAEPPGIGRLSFVY